MFKSAISAPVMEKRGEENSPGVPTGSGGDAKKTFELGGHPHGAGEKYLVGRKSQARNSRALEGKTKGKNGKNLGKSKEIRNYLFRDKRKTLSDNNAFGIRGIEKSD